MAEMHDDDNRTRVTRRRFLQCSAAAGCVVVPRSVLGGQPGNLPPSERLNIAGVGLGARGLGNMEKCTGTNIVAVCDVDFGLARTALERHPDAGKYQDYRKMLDDEHGIDAVVISTPDHTHAVIAAEAMKRGMHVFVETPLAHSVWETRELARIARETGVTTQMGNERHSCPGLRRAVEMLWAGGLGPIEEVHCWTNRPQWPQGMNRKYWISDDEDTGKPWWKSDAPKGLDWDLWLGPAQPRSYDRTYHPYRWRGWLDFGSGALGAMGCQLLDVVFWGLNLGAARTFTIEAESTGVDRETFPKASTIRYRFPARGDLPPVTLTWYDGGRKPSRPEQLPTSRR